MVPEQKDIPKFQPKALEAAEEYFKDVHMSQSQHDIFSELVKVFLEFIKMDEIAVKGIGWRAITNWQLKYKRDLTGINDEDPEDRIKSMKQVFECVKKELYNAVSNDDQKPLVDKSIDAMLRTYGQKYAFR